ncbi:MAG TPA: leucine-rich repeat domain-containing protein, partial [Planctomycetaceae bacterium]|nr:leucine-rich repeat domain-containing protein [Planctomycetaceae bacterium]
MTNEHDDKLSGLLAQAVQQLVATPQANERPADLDTFVLRELSRADDAAGRLASTAATQRKEKRSMPLLVKCSLAASLLIAVGAATWLGLMGGTNSVYGAVAERLGKLKSVVYRVQWVEEAGLVNAVAGDGDKVMCLGPSHDRVERSNGSVLVIDTEVEKAIDLNPATKKALVMSGPVVSSVATIARGPASLLDTLRKHFRVGRTLPQGIEELGRKEIGGIQARGLRSTIHGEIVEAWIDPATSLPVEVRLCLVIPAQLSGLANQTTRMWRVMSAFQFDVAVDPSLMSVEAPSGYTVIQMPELSVAKNAAAPSLTDLIELLRLCAQHNDSTFPASLSMNDTPGTCMAIMKRFTEAQEKAWESGTKAEKQALMKAVTDFGAAMGRVTPFLFSLRPENKLRYVGAGVKRDAPDRPILWFSPKGNTQFQVVYADLSVREIAESALPRLPAAGQSKLEEQTIIRSTSPRVVFPQSGVKQYDALQGIRKTGRQDEVRFIELHLMPEFMKNAAPDSKDDRETSRFRFLEEFQNLEGLRVDNLFLTENDLHVIGQCHNLKKLSLAGIQIFEAAHGMHRLQGTELRHLSQLTNLEMLDLSQSDFSGGLQHLGVLPKLDTLILSSFENLNDASIAQLKQLPHLQTLVLAAVYANNPEKTVTDA